MCRRNNKVRGEGWDVRGEDLIANLLPTLSANSDHGSFSRVPLDPLEPLTSNLSSDVFPLTSDLSPLTLLPDG